MIFLHQKRVKAALYSRGQEMIAVTTKSIKSSKDEICEIYEQRFRNMIAVFSKSKNKEMIKNDSQGKSKYPEREKVV